MHILLIWGLADLRLLLPLFCCCFNTPLAKNLFRPYQSAEISYVQLHTSLYAYMHWISWTCERFFDCLQIRQQQKIPKQTKNLRILHTESDISGWYHAVGAWLKATWSPFELQPTCCSPTVPCSGYSVHLSYVSLWERTDNGLRGYPQYSIIRDVP